MTAVNTTSYPTRDTKNPGAALTPDSTAMFGLLGQHTNIKAANGKVDLVAIAIASSTTPVLTAAQFVSDIWDVSGSPGGGFTLTTPTAAQIIAALPSTIPQDGYFNFDIECINDDTGQTATVTAGSGVTVLGNATVATNTNRLFLVNVNVLAGTVKMINRGTMSL